MHNTEELKQPIDIQVNWSKKTMPSSDIIIGRLAQEWDDQAP